LSLDTTLANQFKKDKNRQDISTVDVGDSVYVDLRFFGDDEWYEGLGLPDWQTSSYVVVFRYVNWYHKNKSKKKISANFELGKHIYNFDNYLVYCWGSNKIFNETTMILVDADILSSFPRITEV